MNPSPDMEPTLHDSPAGATQQSTRKDHPLKEEQGMRIGRYKLLQKLGEGGCGTVFLAEQEEPVKRRVALKVIKLGMDTRQVVARFEAERQALAMMDHPNIAKVLDAGATDTGRPFFVMELVRGVRITEYCDQAKLGAKERLELFTQVCSAIQHAHQKGIIHRDIKPSNILVTLHDGISVPKVIDFGIAKATQQQLTEKTLFTELQQFIGTPAYMSPEQAELSGLDIDTRSDIYSLGVLLYELLTGRTPFDSKELIRSGLDEIRRRIREDEPPRPSTRLSTLDASELSEVANRRHAPPPQLIGILRGDLDWIVMKCLEKDRSRRYDTATALALDIRRFLSHEPVTARPPSAGYKMQKFARRHKYGFAAAGSVTLALLLGLGFSLWSYLQERKARARAESAEQTQSLLLGQAESARKRAVEAQSQAEAQRKSAEEQKRKAEESELLSRRFLYAADMNLAQQALKANNLGRARRLLDRHRPASRTANSAGSTNSPSNLADLRGWEWRYLWQQCLSGALFNLTNRPSRAMSVSISHDGTHAAVGYYDGWTGIFDLNKRQLVQMVQTNGVISNVKFSPNAPVLGFAGKYGYVRLLRLGESKEQSLSMDNEGSFVSSVAFSPDGKRVAGLGIFDQTNGRIRVWDAGTGQMIQSMDVMLGGNLHQGRICFSADGETVFAGGTGKFIEARRISDGTQLWRVEGSEDWGLTAIAASPNGDVVATAFGYGDSFIRIWNIKDGTLLTTLEGHSVWTCDLDFSRDGKRLISAAADQSLRIWDTSKWKETAVLRGHGDEVHAAAFSPDGRLVVSGSKDGAVLVWDAVPSLNRSPHFLFPPETQFVHVLNNNTNALVIPKSGGLGIWNLHSREKHMITLPTNGTVNFMPPDTLFHYDRVKWLVQFRVAEDGVREVGRIEVGPNLRGGDYWPETGLLAFGTSTNRIELVGIDSLDRRRVISSSRDKVLVPIRFFDAGRHLAAFNELGEISCWNVAKGERVPGIEGRWMRPDQSLGSVRSKVLALVAVNQHTKAWELLFCNLSGGTNSIIRQPFTEEFTSMDLSLDERFAVVGTATAKAMIYEVASGRHLRTLHGHLNSVSGLAFSPDGSRLATGSGAPETLKLWDVVTGQEVLNIVGEGSLFRAIEFSPDGNTIIAGSRENNPIWIMVQAPSWQEIEVAERASGGWTRVE